MLLNMEISKVLIFLILYNLYDGKGVEILMIFLEGKDMMIFFCLLKELKGF